MKSKQEAIQWASRVPFEADGPSATSGGVGEIEIRQVFEMSDFPPDAYESEEARAALESERKFREGQTR